MGTLMGLPVVLDANIPITSGSNSQQDNIILLRAEDAVLYSSPPKVRVMTQALGAQMTVVIQLISYVAFALRHANGCALVTGLSGVPFGS